jgi:rod shape-determining protein MreD
MIWILPIISILLFYLLAILQTSFFMYFNLFGALPNLVFTLFFLLIFFNSKNQYLPAVFFGFFAGLFLDIFSIFPIGSSIILLTIVGLLVKKIQSLLKEKKEDYPFIYFIVLFAISLVIYELLLRKFAINLKLVLEIIYSSIFATTGFFIYKKFFKQDKNNKTNRLF